MYHKELDYNPAATRTLEIHKGKSGWYFTVHQEATLIYSSLEMDDRVKATEQGMSYLDTLNHIDHEARKQKGTNRGP